MEDRKQFMVKMLALSFACCMVAAVGTSCGDGNADSGSDSTGSDSSVQDYGEAGTYYSLTNGESSRLTLEGGEFTLEIGGERIEGTYTYDGETMSLVPSSGSVSGVTYEGGVIRLTYGGTEYVFDKTAVYGVTYSVEGETETEYVKSGETAERPADPEKEGYIFAGWYTDSEYRTSFSFSQPITRDITLYARFVEALKGPFEFTVTFDLNYEGAGEAPEAMETTEGKVYNLPEAEREGYEFVGWWTSDYGDGEKLTGRYEEEELEGNTTLYAKWREEGSGTPAVTVKESGISWTAVGVNSQYTVTVRSAEGRVLLNQMTPSTSYAFDFAEEEAGDYEVTVAVFGGESETAYYRNKALAGVSIFKTEGNILQFNPIEGAERYVLEIECGNGTHENERIELGSATQYDFSACDMQDGGIVFTVHAEAEGYISSEAEYVFEQNLEAVTAVSFDGETETASWAAVENAESYYVRVEVDGTEVFAGNIGNELSYCVKTYGPGEIVIEVTPVAKMYNSPTGTEYTYTKATPATPTGLRVEGTEIVWNEAAGATGYVVKIGEAEHTVTGTRYEFTEEDYVEGVTAYEISVKAVGSAGESVYSDVLTANYGGMSEEVRYAGNVVSWEAVFGIEKYVVQVNDGEEIEVADGTSCEIELTKAGENIIRVCSVDAEGKRSEWVTTTVTGYEISFVTDTETGVDSVYRATGDKLNLPTELERTGYDFSGWYSEPDGGGTAYGEGAFEGEQGMTLYANWTGKFYTVSFNIGTYGEEDVESVQVQYGQPFELPVAESYENTMAFGGWYADPNGQGLQFSDYEGNSVADWNIAGDITVHAYWAAIFSFNKIQGGYSVSAGDGIDFVRTVTIPETYHGERVTAVNTFAGSKTLEIIRIPSSVEVITLGSEGTAFYNCTSLRRVEILPLEYVQEPQYSSKDGVLFTADGKTLLFFPENKAADLENGVYTVPDGTTEIFDNAFTRASDLEEVIIPAGVQRIGVRAFYSVGSDSLKRLTFLATPEGAETVPLVIESQAFALNDALEEITLPSRMTDISLSDMLETTWSSAPEFKALKNIYVAGTDGDYCSADGVLCRKTEDGSAEIILYPEGREGDYVVPEVVSAGGQNISVTSIAAGAFEDHYFLTGVTIPAGITYIGESAFEGCENLVRVDFLGTAESLPLTIAERAFYECSSYGNEWTSVTLPANLVSLGMYAFGGNYYLKTVTVNLDGDRFAGLAEIDYSENAFAYATSSRTSYVQTVNLGAGVPELDIASVFGGAVTSVNVAEGNENYMSVDGVLFNGNGTQLLYFPNRSGEYVVPDAVTTIGTNVFRGRSITKITLGANVTSIGDYAFYSCGSLKEVVFTSSTAAAGLTVGDYAFGECDSLSVISLPVGTTSIGSHAFYRCDALTSFTIPEGVTSIGEMAFAESALTSISIPSTVTYMGEAKSGTDGDYYYFDVFSGCTSLASVTVDAANNSYASVDGVLYAKTVIDVNGDLTAADNYYISALAYCPVQKSGVVDVPSTVRAIWQNAFYGNQKVTEVTFSEGLKEVSHGEVVIPAELTLSQGAFQSCAALAKVTLPEGVSTIGAQTFYQCNALTDISIPSTVSYIAPRAFEACLALANVTFAETPEGQTAVALVIGDSASSNSYGVFTGCQAITSLTLPERTTELGRYAFQGCIGLTTLHLPSTLTSIGQYAFQNVPLNSLTFAEGSQLKEIGSNAFNKSLLPTISLPEGLETIGSSAFAYSKLQSITIPASVRTISSSAFSYCYDLESVVFAPDSLIEELASGAFSYNYRLKSVTFNGCISEGLEIGRTTFQACTALESFIVPENTTLIDQYAFRYCASMTNFRFESVINGTVSKLAKINNYAFVGAGFSEFVFPESSAASISLGSELFSACPNLTSVTLSPQVTDIEDVFTGCVRIETIMVPAENQNFISSGGVIYNQNQTAVDIVYVYSATAPDAEGNTLADENGRVVLPSGVTQIAAGAFAGRDDITSIVIPASVQSIGMNAFNGCVNLKEVVFESGSQLTSIGTYAFQYCRSLQSISIPSGVTDISNYAFDYCTSLTSVTLPSGLTRIGNSAFRYSGLTSVSIPATVTTFGTYAFAYNASLASVDFNGNTSVRSLGNYMFLECTSLTEVTLPTSLTFLGTYTFRGSGLTRIDLSGLTGLQYLGTGASACSATSSVYLFADCADLAEVILPEGLTRIGGRVFQNCTSLTSIDLTGLEMIGSYCFQNTGLTSVHIPGITTAANLAAGAFMDCSALATLTFEEGTVRLNNYAFQNCTSLTEITLPTSITGLQSDIFRGCTSLRKVTINSHLTSSLGDDIFTDCSALSEVTIGEGTTTLGDYMFYGLKNLKTIKLPSTLTYLGTHTFEGSGITEIDLSDMTGMTHMGSSKSACSTGSDSYVFADCKDLTTVKLPSSLTKIGAYAFYGCENLTDIDLSSIVQFNDFSFAGTPLTIRDAVLRSRSCRRGRVCGLYAARKYRGTRREYRIQFGKRRPVQ